MVRESLNGEPFEILLVEDNEDHAELIMRSLKDNRVANRVHLVVNGRDALDYLFRRGEYTDVDKYPMPHVILLDLRLPMIDGLAVLKEIKESEELNTIPVVILTTSESEKDIAQAYELHANSYVVKPVDFKSFTELMRELGFYWLGWNRSPWN